jgi:hypothetical protein
VPTDSVGRFPQINFGLSCVRAFRPVSLYSVPSDSVGRFSQINFGLSCVRAFRPVSLYSVPPGFPGRSFRSLKSFPPSLPFPYQCAARFRRAVFPFSQVLTPSITHPISVCRPIPSGCLSVLSSPYPLHYPSHLSVPPGFPGRSITHPFLRPEYVQRMSRVSPNLLPTFPCQIPPHTPSLISIYPISGQTRKFADISGNKRYFFALPLILPLYCLRAQSKQVSSADSQ